MENFVFALNNTTTALQSTTPLPAAAPLWVGYVALIVAVIFFGSNWAPIKKVETGDGTFFLWISGTGILLVGIAVQVYRTISSGNPPTFHPFVMLGGLIWMVGNIPMQLMVHTIGLGIALLLWSTSNMLIGWSSDRFGLFGTDAHVPSNEMFNYLSLLFAILRIFVFAFITPTTSTSTDSEERPLLVSHPSSHYNSAYYTDPDQGQSGSGIPDAQRHIQDAQASSSISYAGDILPEHSRPLSPSQATDESFLARVDRLPSNIKRIIGCSTAMLSGLCFGVCFVPVSYVIKHVPGASNNWLDYVFAQYMGVWVGFSVYFALYSAFYRGSPVLYPKAILPGLLSGAMWGIGQAGFFLANGTLSPAIAFPIVSSVPAIFATMWSIFVFGEIRGRFNYILVVIGFVIIIVGAIFGALSKLSTT